MKRAVRGACALVMVVCCCAHAYIGPGVGVTMIGWFVGVVIALAAGAGAVIIWPVRNFLRTLRAKRIETSRPAPGADEPDRAN